MRSWSGRIPPLFARREKKMMSEQVERRESMAMMPFDVPSEWNELGKAGNALTHIFKAIMVRGVDYGVLPGGNKPSCYKPGAELLSKYFNIRDEISEKTCDRQLTGENPYVSYTIRVSGFNGRGEKISDGEGYCSSLDPKYMKSMTTQMDRMRQKGDKVSMINMVAWIDNTILKMAIKRAYVDMILRATGASRIFTQDAEDMYDVIDGEVPPDIENSHRSQPAGNAGQKSSGSEEREMSAKQRDRIMEGLEGKMKKYGPLFVEYYGQKEPLFNAKVKLKDGKFVLNPTTVPEANTILQNIIWLDSEADADFQAWLKKRKAVLTA